MNGGDGDPRFGGIIIASTRAAAGHYEDECAPLIRGWLRDQDFVPLPERIVPDGERVADALADLLDAAPAVIITSGGTGLSPDDATPEITARFVHRELPGVMEAIRAAGVRQTPLAALGRGMAGTVGGTFIVNLPGSPRAVADGLTVLEPLIGHICEQLEGSHEH